MLSINKPGGHKKFLTWFGLIMVLLYLTCGVTILVRHYFSIAEPGNLYQAGLGWLLISYGLFRSYRVYKDFRPLDDDE